MIYNKNYCTPMYKAMQRQSNNDMYYVHTQCSYVLYLFSWMFTDGVFHKFGLYIYTVHAYGAIHVCDCFLTLVG